MSHWSLQAPNLVLMTLLLLGIAAHLQGLFRTDRSAVRKMTVAVLNVVFVALLWLFLQPPSASTRHQQLTLLTPGATASQLRAAERSQTAIAIGSPLSLDNNPRTIKQHLDLRSVRATYPHATTLKVLGAGLPEQFWQADASWDVLFDPPVPGPGFRHVHWSKRVNVGNVLTVSGRVAHAESAFVELVDPAGDRVRRVSTENDGRFALTTNVRSPGRFLYRLDLIGPDDNIIESQRLPVHVSEPEPISLLMILSAPSFESRSMKHWAGLGGAKLAVRTAISDSRYLDEFIEREALSAEQLNSLDPSVLSQLDLVVLDQRALRTLNVRQQNALYTAAEQDGLGLLILAGDGEQPIDANGRFPMLEPYSERQRRLAYAPASENSAAEPPEVTLAPARFAGRPDPNDVIMRDANGLPIAVYARAGRGRLGVTLVVDSHTLMTSGQPAIHARYWRTLVAAMTAMEPGINGEFAPELPVTNEQVQLCVFGSSLPDTAEINGTLSIPLRPQAYRPQERCGYWWPDRPGWHVVTASNLTRHLYVFTPEDWQTRRLSEATAATLLATQREPVFVSSDLPTREQVPRTVFAWCLLMMAGILWIEQKLFNR